MENTCAKGLIWKECNTSCSQGVVPFSASHLKTHLLKILIDHHLSVSASLGMTLPVRKVLPTLGEFVDDTEVEDEYIIQDMDQLTLVSQDRRNQLVESG